MTNRGPGNGVYKPDDFSSAYVNVPMMSAIYGGNTSEGSPRAMSFKLTPSDSGVTMAMKKAS